MKWERVTDWVGANESLGQYKTGKEWCLQEVDRIMGKGGHARLTTRRTYQKEYAVQRPSNEVNISVGEE